MSIPIAFKPVTDSQKNLNYRKVYGDLLSVEHKSGMFFYGGQPISMMSDSLMSIVKRVPETNEFVYNVTPKLDGVRFLMLVHPLVGMVFIDRNLTFFELKNYDQPMNIEYVTLADGEYYEQTDTFFIFDVLIDRNERAADYIFDERYQRIKSFDTSQLGPLPIRIVYKYYFDLGGFDASVKDLYAFICELFDSVYKDERGGFTRMEYDGLIFTPRFTKYIIGDNWKYPNNILFKWKPSEHQTIDFIVPNPSSDRVAFIAKRDGKYMPFKNRSTNDKFRVSKDSLEAYMRSKGPDESKIDFNTTVLECRWNYNTRVFDVVRDRPDKAGKPNTLKSAESTWKLINQNMNISDIMPFITSRIPDDFTDQKFRESSIFGKSGELERTMINCKMVDLVSENDHIAFLSRYVTNVVRMNNSNNNNNDRSGMDFSDKDLEFEIRIGKYNFEKKSFNTNVQYKHFDWLRKTLDTYNLPRVYTNTTDVFDSNGNRTTYFYYDKDSGNGIRKTIKKERHDTRTITDFEKIYNYSFRLSVSTEQKVDNYHVDINSAVNYRNKRRMSYMIDDGYVIDMTEYVDKKKPDSPRFQVEIEMKSKKVDVKKLNSVLRFVMYNLYGKSQIL